MWRDNISQMLVPELEAIAQAVRDGRPAPITASAGRQVLEVLDAVAESGRTRHLVSLV